MGKYRGAKRADKCVVVDLAEYREKKWLEAELAAPRDIVMKAYEGGMYIAPSYRCQCPYIHGRMLVYGPSSDDRVLNIIVNAWLRYPPGATK
jgi:hypothetical protein